MPENKIIRLEGQRGEATGIGTNWFVDAFPDKDEAAAHGEGPFDEAGALLKEGGNVGIGHVLKP